VEPGPRAATVRPVDNEDIFRRTTANRLRAADMLSDLTPEQWSTPSLCAGWTIRELGGHLLMPMELSVPRFLLALVRARGSADGAVDSMSRSLAQRPTEEIVQTLIEKADSRVRPPGVGPLGPMADSCIHLRDGARPLGLDVTPPLDDWRLVLDFLHSPAARRGFVPAGRLAGLCLRATDQDWRAGEGADVAGPSEALALAMSGRPAALADLGGDGLPALRERLGAHAASSSRPTEPPPTH
jgi:uncharacterized protein (TIGR03083 family)